MSASPLIQFKDVNEPHKREAACNGMGGTTTNSKSLTFSGAHITAAAPATTNPTAVDVL